MYAAESDNVIVIAYSRTVLINEQFAPNMLSVKSPDGAKYYHI